MNKRINLALVILPALLILAACSGSEGAGPSPNNATPAGTTVEGRPMTKQYNAPPPLTIVPETAYTATIETNFGQIVAELFPKEAPLAVNSFIFLAREGYFDGVKFHRVVKGFVIQSGDPTGSGTGGPGYRFADEPVTRNYESGTLAMANSGPNTNGSQFFITLANLTGRLPKNYTIFGQVTAGMDVVEKIGGVPVVAGRSGELSTPTVDVQILTVKIDEKTP